MLCRIAEHGETAAPVRWQQIRRPETKPENPPTPFPMPAQVPDLQRSATDAETPSQADFGQAKQAAFEDGLRQGREEAGSALRDCAERLGKSVADLGKFKAKLRADAERELVKLSLAIARRILHRELAIDPEALQGVAHAALSKLHSRDILQVRVFAEGAEAVKSYLDRAGLSKTVKLAIDPSLRPGDLLVDTVFGELDASVDTQLVEIDRGFADRLGAAS